MPNGGSTRNCYPRGSTPHQRDRDRSKPLPTWGYDPFPRSVTTRSLFSIFGALVLLQNEVVVYRWRKRGEKKVDVCPCKNIATHNTSNNLYRMLGAGVVGRAKTIFEPYQVATVSGVHHIIEDSADSVKPCKGNYVCRRSRPGGGGGVRSNGHGVPSQFWVCCGIVDRCFLRGDGATD